MGSVFIKDMLALCCVFLSSHAVWLRQRQRVRRGWLCVASEVRPSTCKVASDS